ncbi:MAG: error-prone DNA repair protein ImuA [Idiomarinaceae bacterium HL-53]|nr:MAG: error-prone DNA repair protein ImuA [Idiomarinaceae bacterium HL-53]CUS47875.1 cell division inhibitor SulA [Idiomarinaceae bacterium HL-53]
MSAETLYMSNQPLAKLLARGDVWQGGSQQVTSEKPHQNTDCHRIATGYEELDEALFGGWQWQRVHEIQVAQPFSGEIALLRSSLIWSGEQKRPTFWIAPPALPFAPGLAHYAAAQSQHVVLTPQSETDALWSAEHILRSGAAGVVFLWSASLSQPACRRLHLAAQQSGALTFVISAPQAEEARPYTTRVRLAANRCELEILKRPSGWPMSLKLPKTLHWLRNPISAH